jgi:DHA1 family tetracycline resistance protein-like MFS transporter
VVFGLAMMVVGLLGIAFATEGWMILVALAPFALCGFAMPALRGLLSRRMPPDAQGELQGALASLVSLTAIVTPVAMTHLFRFFTSGRSPVVFPGAPFLTAAALAAASLAFFLRAARRLEEPAPRAGEEPT